jgi:hypothetical protein
MEEVNGGEGKLFMNSNVYSLIKTIEDRKK